jgi:hypothetical protein
MGLTTTAYIHYITFDFSPYDFPSVLLHPQKALFALLVALCSCFFHASPLSNANPRYLMLLVSWIILLKRIGSLGPFKFLFLVKGITTVLLAFMVRFVLPLWSRKLRLMTVWVLPSSGGRSVDIVCLQTKSHGVCFFVFLFFHTMTGLYADIFL